MADQPNTKPASWSTALWLVPWIAAGFVLWVTIAVDRSLDLGSLGFDQRAPVLELTDLAGASRRLLAGVAWAISALSFSLVALAAAIASVFVAATCLGDLGRPKGAVNAIAIAMAALALVAIVKMLGVDIMTEPQVTEQLRALT